jgi:hypothetical protein
MSGCGRNEIDHEEAISKEALSSLVFLKGRTAKND